jgi:membrane protease YdiL (CAAX protease family)
VLRLLGALLIGLVALMILQPAMLLLAKSLGWRGDDQSLNLIYGTLGVHGGALVGVLVFLRLHGLTWRTGLGLRIENAGSAFRWGLGAAVVFLPVAWVLGQLSVLMLEAFGIEAPQQSVVKLLQELRSPVMRVYLGVFALFLAPIAEEVLFRGIMYPALKQVGLPRAALWITSLLFAAIHINLMSFVPLLVLALVLVFVYERTDNLLAPILAHSLFNAANLFVLLAFPKAANASPP